jgi:uncharacterized RDD family membrane protein YckC
MEVRCSGCQATNPPQAAWCNQCGMTFAPAAVGQPSRQQAAWSPPGGPGPSAPTPPASWGQPGYVPPGQEPLSADLAGVWPRVGARLLDGLLVNLVLLALGVAWQLPDGTGYWLLPVVLLVVSETGLLANGGQTLAKMLLGLRVVRADRAPLSVREALIRSATIGGTWLVPLGWAICGVVLEKDRRRQGWHDRAAGTLVVTTRHPA